LFEKEEPRGREFQTEKEESGEGPPFGFLLDPKRFEDDEGSLLLLYGRGTRVKEENERFLQERCLLQRKRPV
jgi:hypothetical protein